MFFGNCGSMSEQAAFDYFGTNERHVFREGGSFQQVFSSVADGTVKYGVVPIENSESGEIRQVYSLLVKSGLFITGEQAVQEDHCLCVLPGVTKDQIKRVYSHSELLTQCHNFLNKLTEENKELERVTVSNSAAGFEKIKTQNMMNAAAIGTHRAASIHGLEVLEQGVGNVTSIATRYIILSKNPCPKASPIAKLRCSLALTVRNETGGLFKMLSCFSFRGINILKLNSRPAAMALELFGETGRHWEYVQFIDYEPHQDHAVNDALLVNLKDYSQQVRNFGTYPKWERPEDHAATFESLWK